MLKSRLYFKDRMFTYLFFIFLTLIFFNCDNGVLFQKSNSIKGKEWSYADPQIYTFEVNDTSTKYDLLLDIHHDRLFPFQNLYLDIMTHFPTDTTTDQQLSLQLMAPNGKWIGTCKGNDCIFEVIMQEGFVFTELGEYKIEINQWSRQETLPGISAIGLYVQESKM